MLRVALVLGGTLVLSGCCTTVRERLDAYARIAAENAETTRILVERCRDGDAEACDVAIRALEDQRAAAEVLGEDLGEKP
jgi:hypothetical protein